MTPEHPTEPQETKGSWLLPLVMLLAVIAAGASVLVSLSATSKPVRASSPGTAIPLVDFQLTAQDAKTFSQDDMLGNVWVVNFIFTRCPGPCLELSRKMAAMTETLRGQKALRFASITVDPEFDTPTVLNNYAGMLGADLSRWRFLTGAKPAVYEVIQKAFLLPVEELEEPTEEGPIAHSTRFVLVDKQGVIRGFFDGLIPESREKLIRSARELAAQSSKL